MTPIPALATVSSLGSAGDPEATVCVGAGRRVSVSGCANIGDAIQRRYVPPPADYAPMPEDTTPPPPPPSRRMVAGPLPFIAMWQAMETHRRASVTRESASTRL
ncbi:hypothetical protein [Mycobacterium tilburgii]|uniref:hypothetical protein n=1 Tax=Mycobacterium tilburgii TaxID=44467 RepID=UPI0021B3D568|nr:hypothetical protein [Mycobacterium tilburgii]